MKLGEPAVGSLIETLEEEYNIDSGAAIRESVAVRGGAARALGKIGDPRAIGPLTQALKDKDSDVRESAKWALGRVREKNI